MSPIKLKYTEQFIRNSIKVYWKKQVGLLLPISTVLLTFVLLYLISIGNKSWFIGMLGTGILLSYTTMTAVYVVHLKRALLRLKRMKTPEAILELGNDRFKISSDIGTSEIEWSQIIKLWRFDSVWLLFFSAGEFMTMPIEEFSEDSKNFILTKLVDHGTNVV